MTRVAVGIIIQERKVLLCQRRRSSRYGLKWEFPGGKLEEGETPEICLHRELLEELGIQASIGTLYYSHRALYADSGDYFVLYYRVTSFSGAIRNNVFESWRWVEVGELAQFDILEGNAAVVARLMEEHAHTGGTN
jgi:8-oxo-dGTP diphosphatase